MGETIAWVEGANERKKDGDLRIAHIVCAVLAAGGMRNPPTPMTVAGYAEDVTIADFDPAAVREVERARAEALIDRKREADHARWIAEVEDG